MYICIDVCTCTNRPLKVGPCRRRLGDEVGWGNSRVNSMIPTDIALLPLIVHKEMCVILLYFPDGARIWSKVAPRFVLPTCMPYTLLMSPIRECICVFELNTRVCAYIYIYICIHLPTYRLNYPCTNMHTYM